MFGGSKDGAFNHDRSGRGSVSTRTWQTGAWPAAPSREDIAILRPEESAAQERALVLAENGKLIIAAARSSTAKPAAGSWPTRNGCAPSSPKNASRCLRLRTDLPPPSPRRDIAGLRLIRSPTYDGHSRPWRRLNGAPPALPSTGQTGAIGLSTT
jgi:hypothetical protein